jgi:hypothetical protein
MRKLSLAEAAATLNYDPATGALVKKSSRRRADFKVSNGYRAVNINNRRFQAHRVAWLLVYGIMPDGQIDHINRTRDDNRLANLRLKAALTALV